MLPIILPTKDFETLKQNSDDIDCVNNNSVGKIIDTPGIC
jgi:hypothetical protein